MAKRLNQVLATEQATRKRSEDAFTKVYQDVQKAELTSGFARTYQPNTEDGEKFPAETKRVVVRAKDALKSAQKALADLFDVTAVKDATNTSARADVVIDGQTVLKNVPATHLLFLEKRMVSVIDFIKRLPVLSADEQWRLDPAQGLFVTEPTSTVKTKKKEEWKVIVPPTAQHPAQTQKMVEDVTVGEWKTVKFSGGLPADEIAAILERAEKAQKAVKVARQEANEQSVEDLSTSPLLTYIFG